LPDFLKHVEQLENGVKIIQQLNQSAEHFTQMWEKCEQKSLTLFAK
jgi:hypothetical protein